MHKIYLIILLLILAVKSNGQQKIRLDFQVGTSGDYEVFLKKGLEYLGYNVQINYRGRNEIGDFDYLMKYEELLGVLSIHLLDNNGNRLKTVSRKTNSRDHIVSYRILEQLTDRRVKLREPKTKTLRTFNENLVEKLDSAIYILTARGASTNTKASIQQVFLDNAKILTGSFQTYFENSEYQYNYRYGIHSFAHVGNQTKGIIIGDSSIQDYVILDDPPEIYRQHLDSISLMVEKLQPEFKETEDDNTNSTLYLIRNTGFNASLVKFKIFLDGKMICKLANNCYAKIPISEGKHRISYQLTGKSPKTNSNNLDVDVQVGEKVYVEMLLRSDAVQEVRGQIVSEVEGRKKMLSLIPNQ